MTKMEEQQRRRVLTLIDLWNVFYRHWWAIILAMIISVGGMFAIIQLTYTPHYSSTATLYILRKEDSTYLYSSSDFSMALDVVNDCTYLLKSHVVLDEVIETLNLNMSYEELYKTISTENPSDTRILEITAETEDIDLSKSIVDVVCTIGVEEINSAMGFDQVNFYESGTYDTEPCNQTPWTTYALVGIITAVITYSAFLIYLLLDDSLKSKDELEQTLGISVLGEIPNFNADAKNRYGYNRYGYKRYGYKRYGYRQYGYGYGNTAKKDTSANNNHKKKEQ